ncbi:cilia- and flagella-associated protein 61-like [Hylaeus volcanicus]|uniref:cilia- and flagella-associated protein 61-like n=1 Tax=Hylaeus volcanicus TaxID=313075 RepID=UPI0023B7DBD5|nr:cilia- and flagella-associated protein 61-like [Hylaeus volcanicus]
MMNAWFGDFEAYFAGKMYQEPPTNIFGVRRMEYSDIPVLERLENVTERNAMFVHFLVWDRRYTGRFFEDLLTGLFDVALYLLHVILVLPPRVIPGDPSNRSSADVFERQMIRISSKCLVNTYSVQSLYVTVRHLKNSRLRMRRVVCDREEDNDLVIPIIDAESKLVKEFYGEYYVSEMVRYPNDYRQLIVSEDKEGLATGVMFLSSRIDVDTLNENFELGPYNGLRKPSENDVIPPESMEPASETFFSIFSRKPRAETIDASFPMTISAGGSTEHLEEANESSSSAASIDPRAERSTEKPVDFSELTFLSEVVSIADYFNSYYQSKMRTSAFGDTIFDVPRYEVPVEDVQLPPRPIYRGEVNAFVLEIFAMQAQIKNRSSKDFIEAAFECFPDLDYCAILLPCSHPFLPFLEYFVRVPFRCNKDFPMTLYVTHRAALLGEIKCREGVPEHENGVRNLVRWIPKAEDILADFDATMKKQRSDLFCYVFQWNDTVVGLAILRAENDATYIRRRYHVEDYVATKNVPQDAYGRILHFVLMPIFSIHLRHFLCEIMRLSGLTVLYYRLTESALSALTRSQPLAICLNAMIFVNPRRRIEYKICGYVETDEPKTEEESFALFMTTPRLAMLGNFIVDAKVVVLHRVCAKIYAINRKEKYVTVMNQGNITYDYLVLSCGLQYQMPQFREEFEAQKKG